MIVTDVSQAIGPQDCRIGVALAPDAPYFWYRAKADAAREFSSRVASCPKTLVIIDDVLPVDLVRRMPLERLFLPSLC